MSPARHRTSAARLTRGVFAGVLAALVFTLGLLAVFPAAHALLHSHPHGHDEAFSTASQPDHESHAAPDTHAAHDDLGCAVTLFAHGVTTPLALPQLEAPRLAWLASLPPASAAARLAAPLHRLPPARGPPSLG